MTHFVTLDDSTELALLPGDVIGVCKHPEDSNVTIIFTDHGNFSTSPSRDEVRSRVETALELAIN